MGSPKSTSSAENFKAVTPSDDDNLTNHGGSETIQTRGILVGVAGDVSIKDASNETVTLYLVAGVIHPIVTNKIMATSTTAEDIVACW